MLWDASFDMNNAVNGKHYSDIMRSIIENTYNENNDNNNDNDNKEDKYTILVIRVVGTDQHVQITYTHMFAAVFFFIAISIMFSMVIARHRGGRRHHHRCVVEHLPSNAKNGNMVATKQQKGKEYLALNF